MGTTTHVHGGQAPRGGGAPWDLVVDITLAVWRSGSYTVSLTPRPGCLAEIRSAAEEAARVLGVVPHVEFSGPVDSADPVVVVSVTFVDPAGRAVRRAQDGLGALLRSVRRTHAA